MGYRRVGVVPGTSLLVSLQVDSLQLTNQVFDCDLIVQQLGGEKDYKRGGSYTFKCVFSVVKGFN